MSKEYRPATTDRKIIRDLFAAFSIAHVTENPRKHTNRISIYG
jgi:hypothetical protein